MWKVKQTVNSLIQPIHPPCSLVVNAELLCADENFVVGEECKYALQ